MISSYTTHTSDGDNVLFSSLLGYFVQDAGDIILTGHARGSWEFLIHHALVRLRACRHVIFNLTRAMLCFLFR